MNARRATRIVLLALGVALAGGAAARAADVALGVRAATSGLGPEITLGLSPRADLRLAGGFYSYDTTYDKTGIHYDATAELRNAPLTLDLHPFAGGFRLSVGAAWDDNRLKVSAPASELVRRYRPELVPLLPANLGTLRGEAKGNSVAPYAGIGWGHPFGAGRVSLSADLGVLYHGEPKASLQVELPGIVIPPAYRPLLDAAVAEEERRLEDELKSYTWLPVVALGVTFRL